MQLHFELSGFVKIDHLYISFSCMLLTFFLQEIDLQNFDVIFINVHLFHPYILLIAIESHIICILLVVFQCSYLFTKIKLLLSY